LSKVEGRDVASLRFDDLIKEAQIIIEPVTEPQARIARQAYRDFGKGKAKCTYMSYIDGEHENG
jgi:ribonuclease VapC